VQQIEPSNRLYGVGRFFVPLCVIMKRLLYTIVASVVALAMTSCGITDDDLEFDKTLLEGYWVTNSQTNGTPDAEYWYYSPNGSGYTWDTSEDIYEDEAQPFTWSLTGATLTQIHIGTMGQEVPKRYTLKILSEMRMVYLDEKSGESRTFIKTTQPVPPTTPRPLPLYQ